MTRAVVLSVVLLGALAAPAIAQNAMSSTQSPPSAGNSNEGGAQPQNSLPDGAETATRTRPGSDVGTTRTQPAVGATDSSTAAR